MKQLGLNLHTCLVTNVLPTKLSLHRTGLDAGLNPGIIIRPRVGHMISYPYITRLVNNIRACDMYKALCKLCTVDMRKST